MFWVYILENPTGMFYIGQTDNLERRVKEHNTSVKGSGKFTHKNGPWKLVYHERFPNRPEAVVRERFIKSRRSAQWIRDYLLGRASPDGHRD
jgi:putative endonuclease